MNTYSMRKPRSFDWAKAFLVSIAVHIALILLWIAAILLEVFVVAAREVVEEISLDQYVTMPMELVESFEKAQAVAEVEPAIEEPTPPEKKFVPTRPNQETSEEVQSARYFGERNTAAASSGEALETGLEVPSQEGREARFEGDMELTDSDFADGDNVGAPGLPGEPLPSAQSSPSPPSKLASESSEPEPSEPVEETPVFEPSEPTEAIELTSEERMENAQTETAKLLALDESIPVPEQVETPEEKKEQPVEEKIPEPKQRANSGGQTGNRGLSGGYDREARKTRLRGTIRRRGESSLEVEDSVKGRFLAKVNKEIEKAWQRECILRREFILPGVLSVSFSIDKAGQVTGFRFDSRIAGGAIQEGFTMRAIQKAKLPPMPPEMIDELRGDQLELNLTFMF